MDWLAFVVDIAESEDVWYPPLKGLGSFAAWAVLVAAITESEGAWKWTLCIILATSIMTFFIRNPVTNIIFWATVGIAVLCLFRLIWERI